MTVTKTVSAPTVVSKAQTKRGTGQGRATKLQHPEGLARWRGARGGETGDGGMRRRTSLYGFPGMSAGGRTATFIVSYGYAAQNVAVMYRLDQTL